MSKKMTDPNDLVHFGNIASVADDENCTTNVTDTWADLLTPEFRSVVPCHWLQFRPPLPQVQYALGAIYVLVMTAGVLGNVSIMWLFSTTRSLRTPSNYLVVNLALSDFLIIAKMPVFIYNSFVLRPAAGLWGCQLYGFLGGLSGTSAIMTIAAMAIERYISISRPLDPFSRMTRSRAGGMVITVWLYALTFSTPPLLGLNRYVPEGFLSSCSFDYLADDWLSRGFIFIFFVAAWCVPLIIVCRCYCGIIVAVRQNQQVFQQHAQRMQVENRNLEKQKKTEIRLAKISFCLISLWTLSWTPYATVALMGIFTDRSLLTPLTSMIPALFCKTASVLDPFVYGLSNHKFKAEIRRRISFRCLSKRNFSTVRESRSYNMRTVYQESHVSDSSEEEENQMEQEGDNKLNPSESCITLCSPKFIKSKKEDTEVKIIKSNASNKIVEDGVKGEANGIQVKNIKIFFIPQMYNVETKKDEIKIRFRRSL